VNQDTTSTTRYISETKKKYGEDNEYMFHLVYYWWIRRSRNITELGLEYKEVGEFE